MLDHFEPRLKQELSNGEHLKNRELFQVETDGTENPIAEVNYC